MGVDITIVRDSISHEALIQLTERWYGTMVKGVADIARDVVALGGDWHMDANVVLIEDGSSQENIWGFNIYPNEVVEKIITFESLINIRPLQNNRSIHLESAAIQKEILQLLAARIPSLKLRV